LRKVELLHLKVKVVVACVKAEEKEEKFPLRHGLARSSICTEASAYGNFFLSPSQRIDLMDFLADWFSSTAAKKANEKKGKFRVIAQASERVVSKTFSFRKEIKIKKKKMFELC
jgi:hypothetical protein